METIEQKTIRLLDKAQMCLANHVRSDTASLLGVLTNVVEQAIAEEREACAKSCEEISGNEPSGADGRFGALDCAAEIRARGDK